MRVKFPNGFETNLPHEIGASFVAAGMATEVVVPAPKPKPYSALKTYDDETIAHIATTPSPKDRPLNIVTTSLGYEREQALAEKTQEFRPLKRNGFSRELISVGAFCTLLGVAPLHVEGMSAERLRHICTAVPKVPDAVSGIEWGKLPYSYEEFMRKGERWIDFLYRIGVGASTLLGWERAQVAAKCAPLNAERALGIGEGLKAAATKIVLVDNNS